MYFRQNLTKIQIIYESNKHCRAFTGFVPENIPLTDIIVSIGNELGFSTFNSSKLLALGSSEPLDFISLSMMEAQDMKQTPFIVKGLNDKISIPAINATESNPNENWE